MEIIKFGSNLWQLIDHNGCILKTGTYDACMDRLCEIENEQYRDFLSISGI
jgi:hypothetical protein